MIKIEWQIIIVEIITFLVLAGLLFLFLFKRIINLLDKRALLIKKDLESAEKNRVETEKIKEDYKKELEELNRKREEIISNARKDAELVKEKILQDALLQAEKFRQRVEEELIKEKEKIFNELKESITDFSIKAAEKIIEAELDEEKNKKLVDKFIEDIPKDDRL
jgi:F-type H+-transporting ATPase subunit b